MITDIDEGNSKQFKDKIEEEEILPRRVVLRGALAVAFGLLLPPALFGCDSRKGANSTGTAPPASPPASANTSDSALPSSPANSANAAAATTPKKISQASVQYQPQPKGEQKCSGCLHFIPESNACKLVDGQISPEGWCKLWVKKA